MKRLLTQSIAFLQRHQPQIDAVTSTLALAMKTVERPGIVSAAHLVIGSLGIWSDAIDIDNPGLPKSWIALLAPGEEALFRGPLRKLDRHFVKTGPAGKLYRTILGGSQLESLDVLMSNGETQTTHFFDGDKELAKEARRKLLTFVQQHLPTQCKLGGQSREGLSIQAIELDYHLSDRAISTARRLKKYYDKGIHRAVMFHGPPGYGKSDLVNAISAFLGMRVLEISVETVSTAIYSGFVSALISAIEVISPDVLIINDIDRIHSMDPLVEFLEKTRKAVKICLYTSNTLGWFDSAMRRPQRIDVLTKVNSLDSAVVKIILGDHQHIASKVSTWPASYLRELVDRITAEGLEDLSEWIAELGLRQTEGQKEFGKPKRKKTKTTPKKGGAKSRPSKTGVAEDIRAARERTGKDLDSPSPQVVEGHYPKDEKITRRTMKAMNGVDS